MLRKKKQVNNKVNGVINDTQNIVNTTKEQVETLRWPHL